MIAWLLGGCLGLRDTANNDRPITWAGLSLGMEWKVTLIEARYAKKVRLTKKQMQPYKARLQRLTLIPRVRNAEALEG